VVIPRGYGHESAGKINANDLISPADDFALRAMILCERRYGKGDG
jgi:hypothetical protein